MDNILNDKVLTIKDVKNHLGIGRNSVYELFNDSMFPSFMRGGKHLILESKYKEWLLRESNKSKYFKKF
jgi:predicted DNA-binding transcriptional regulator AlpA